MLEKITYKLVSDKSWLLISRPSMYVFSFVYYFFFFLAFLVEPFSQMQSLMIFNLLNDKQESVLEAVFLET